MAKASRSSKSQREQTANREPEQQGVEQPETASNTDLSKGATASGLQSKQGNQDWQEQGREAEVKASASKARMRAGEWKMQREWKAGLRVASVNVNSKGTLLRLFAGWSLGDEYDIVLV